MRTTSRTTSRTTRPRLLLAALLTLALFLPQPAAAAGSPGASLEQARAERQAREAAEQQEQRERQAREALDAQIRELEARLRAAHPRQTLPPPLPDPVMPPFTAPDPGQGRVAAEQAARQHAQQRVQTEYEARMAREQRLRELQQLWESASAAARTTPPPPPPPEKKPIAPPPPPPEGVAKKPADHTNSLGMEFMHIRRGTFQMGCGAATEGCKVWEKPAHKVTLTKDFYLGRHEVTQRQWQAVMGTNPSRFKNPDHPVESVTWDEVQTFIRKLNEREGHKRYRLPTEAEWEYAARAGSKTAYSFGDDPAQLGDYAWFIENSGRTEGNESGGGAHLVGHKKANAWGLYDMHGNVWEWVHDWGGKEGEEEKGYGSAAPATDPRGPATGDLRVVRGGSWDNTALYCRSAYRNIWGTGKLQDYRVGFRLALTPAPQKKKRR